MKDYRRKLEFLVTHKVYGPFGNYDGLIEIYFTTNQADTPEGRELFFKSLETTREKIKMKRKEFFEIIQHTQMIFDILESCHEEDDPKELLGKLATMKKLYEE